RLRAWKSSAKVMTSHRPATRSTRLSSTRTSTSTAAAGSLPALYLDPPIRSGVLPLASSDASPDILRQPGRAGALLAASGRRYSRQAPPAALVAEGQSHEEPGAT